jgi:hypothetical protein
MFDALERNACRSRRARIEMEIEMATATALKPSAAPKQLPAPNSDFYQIEETLSAEERAILKKVRDFMDTKVAPVINKYWVEDAFPFELIPRIRCASAPEQLT